MKAVRVSYIDHLLEELARFNRLDLEDVRFLDYDGNTIDIDPETIRRFELTGLANQDFVSGRYWERSG